MFEGRDRIFGISCISSVRAELHFSSSCRIPLFILQPCFFGRLAHDVFIESAKIAYVFKTRCGGNLGNRKIFIFKQLYRAFYAQLVAILYGCHTVAFGKKCPEGAYAYVAGGGKL